LVSSFLDFNIIKLDMFYLVLDLQKLQYDHLYEGSKASQVLLDFPILAEVIEEMMLSRYHLTSSDEKWSEDALSFLSCTLSGSLDTLMNVRGC
jgi:hypothetical protein